MTKLESYLQEHREVFEQDLFELLRIPSISASSEARPDVLAAGQWVADRLTGMGLETELISTDGHPIVFAQTPSVANGPTVLVYGHYDVQPPDPLAEWHSPPFEPTVRNGNVVARGATDDKGQMLTHVQSVRAWLATVGKLPIQIKFLIEGEEEVGSRALHHYLPDHTDQLACDVVVISDTSQFGPGMPAITYGLKGIAYFELTLTGAKQDLHSGTFGGAVANPANALTQLLARFIDNQGRVQIPGFYDDVIPVEDRERQNFAALPFDETRFMQRLEVDALAGEVGYTTLERRWVRPTFDINGLTSGYQGEGAKTVLPASASAKFSFRLVPNQDPTKIAAALRAFLQQHCPPGIRLQLAEMHHSPGVVVSLDSPYVHAAATAIHRAFERPPVFIREGGSIPVVTAFRQHLGSDTLLLGWGQDDDNTHGPNEKFSLADYHRGIRASAYLWEELGKISRRG